MDEPTLRRRDFLARTASRRRARGLLVAAGRDAARPRRPPRSASALPSPRNLPIDHVVVVMMENRSFDHYFGWLDGADGDQTQTYVDAASGERGGDAPRLVAGGRVAGLRASRSGPRLGVGARAARRRVPRCGERQRRVRADLLRRGRDRVHPRRGEGVHGLRPLLLLGARRRPGPTGTTSGRRSRAGARTTTPPLETAGNQWETIFDRALGRGVERALLQLRPAVLGRLGRARRDLDAARWPSTTRTARWARCRTSRSSTRRSATAAAATASRPTSTRTATCASARRGWPTSCARSCSRPATGAARCSSSTTSGAGSSTTCARRGCATRGRARDPTRTSARWASASRPSRSRRTRAGAAAATRACATRRSASSRS